jgi:hypothetical protein
MRVQHPESIHICKWASSTSDVPSPARVAVSAHLSNCDKGNVTLAYFLMKYWEKFTNQSKTYTSRIDYGVQQSSTIEILSDSMLIPSELITI